MQELSIADISRIPRLPGDGAQSDNEIVVESTTVSGAEITVERPESMKLSIENKADPNFDQPKENKEGKSSAIMQIQCASDICYR